MSDWSIVYDSFEIEHEPLREALTTLGNGYFATRGANEECQADEQYFYPGTYLAGGYNRLVSTIANRNITNEDLVNWPNWLFITFRPSEGKWLNLQAMEILSYQKELNMQAGVLLRIIEVRDHEGRETRIESRRIVHMGLPHYAAIEYSITPLNWSGSIHIKSGLDGSVINAGVARYRTLNSKHLNVLEIGEQDKNKIFIHVESNQSLIRMAQVARHQLSLNKTILDVSPSITKEDESISAEYIIEVKKQEKITLEKIVSLYTSKDNAISECLHDAMIASKQAPSFKKLLASHMLAWERHWHRSDVQIKSDFKIEPELSEQAIIRLHIFHLLQTISLNSVYNDVGVPARGLHGEAYRGHIFWDELFIFPFYTFRLPEITRSLLLYRYNRLNMAKCLAEKAGYRGAMFPWQSSSNGEEETQLIHLNPRTNTWGPDLSRYQRHVNIAIAYNVWHYFLVTRDTHFLTMYGAEMMLEIARFWGSIAQYNEAESRYEIHHVVGPDEYHEQYPDTDDAGVNNNAYTNVMAVWVLEKALEALEILQPDRRFELLQHLALSEEEINQWHDIRKKMKVPFHDDGVISQFEGYDDLEELDWDGYLKKYGNIERLDRILKAEGDSPNRYKVSKQADVLMLFYLLPKEELTRIFHQLGYPEFNEDCIQKTIAYYQSKTSHGSTLSKVVFASELGQIDQAAAYSHYQEALLSDISDIQGGTTPEGIHLGAMSGTVDICFRQYAGVKLNEHCIHFLPNLPIRVHHLAFRMQFRGNWYQVKVTHEKLQLTLEPGHDDIVTVYVNEKVTELEAGKEREFHLND